MKLCKRTEYSNIYEIGGGKFKGVLGGVPNILSKGNLVPIENNLVDTGEPGCVWKPKRAPGNVKFQNRGTNKYLTQVETDAGEKIFVTMPAMPSATPNIQPDGVTIKWTFPNGNTVTKAVTEKGVKETVFQKAGGIVKFKYATEELDVVKKTGYLEFNSKTTGKLVFKTEAPYDVSTGQTIPVTINKTGNTWSITYPAQTTDREIDPTLIFGEGAGYIGGIHKDTFLLSTDVDDSQASSISLQARLAVAPGGRVPLWKFTLENDIPVNAIVNSAVLSITLRTAPAGNITISNYQLITPWGVTPTNEGISQDPANGGQATWRRSFDFNGAGGDVAWNAGNFSVADYNPVENTWVVLAADIPGTVYNLDFTNMTRNWVSTPALNYGVAMLITVGVIGQWTNLYSQEELVPANRPYLTVDYTVPSDDAVRRVLKSHMGLTQNAMSL